MGAVFAAGPQEVSLHRNDEMEAQRRALEGAPYPGVRGVRLQVRPGPSVGVVERVLIAGAELVVQLRALGIEGLQNAESDSKDDFRGHGEVREEKSGLKEACVLRVRGQLAPVGCCPENGRVPREPLGRRALRRGGGGRPRGRTLPLGGIPTQASSLSWLSGSVRNLFQSGRPLRRGRGRRPDVGRRPVSLVHDLVPLGKLLNPGECLPDGRPLVLV